MKNLKFLPTMLSIAFVLSCLNVSVSAQTDDKNRIANVTASGDTIKFDVLVQNAGATLSVAASNGKVYRKEFKAGESPSFAIYDKSGNRLPDGQFTYDLRLAPVLSSDLRKEMVASREKSNDVAEDVDDRSKTFLPSHPLVQSGAFAVLRGTIILAGGAEPDAGVYSQKRSLPSRPPVRPNAYFSQDEEVFMAAVSARTPVGRAIVPGFAHAAFPDQVIPDDLIVQGSLCVGFDCVNNESFSFDTIRMKENNTRIKFDDTSTTAGYSANDWQLTANDSASGGLSKFSIEDITGAKIPFTVEAGASTNSIYVDSTGRVGFRTSTPVLDLHTNTSNTPAIRFEQNNSGGFTAQTWDIGANEANFFIRDVTGGSKLSFRIRPGAPTSSIDISADGDVGIGTASPQAKLDIKQSEDSFIGGLHLRRELTSDTWAIATGSDNNLYMAYANSASGANAASDFSVIPIIFTTTGRVGIGTSAPDQTLSVIGDASKSAGGTTWQTFSDERLKNIKGQFTSGLKAVMQLQPLRYEYRPGNALGLKSRGEQIGFGAQALQKVIPEAVSTNEKGYLMINSDPILWTMLNAIKEQQKEIEQLKAQIQRLQPRAGGRRGARNRRR